MEKHPTINASWEEQETLSLYRPEPLLTLTVVSQP